MKLQEVYIRDFRGLKDVKVEFDTKKNIHVLIGNNGCGKTSILEAIDYLFNNDYNNKIIYDDFYNYDLKNSINIKLSYNSTNEDYDALCKIGLKSKTSSKKFYNSFKYEYKINGTKYPIGFKYQKDDYNEHGTVSKYNRDDKLENLPNIIFLSKNRLNDITNSYNSILKNTIDYLNYKVKQENAGKIKTKKYTENIKNYDDAYINNKEEIAKIVGEINEFFRGCNNEKKDDNKKATQINLSVFNNLEPYNHLCFVDKDTGIPLSKMGSGVEMIAMIIFFIKFCVDNNDKEKLLLLIDEPEQNLHPKFQNLLIDFLKDAEIQCIFTSHSPTFVKHCMNDKNCEVLICEKDGEKIEIKQMKKKIEKDYKFLANHTNSQAVANFLAFNEYSTDLHNLLYGLLEEKDKAKLEQGNLVYYKQKKDGTHELQNNKSLSYIIRNLIHHPENKNENNLKYKEPQENFEKYLKQSIDKMIELLKQV